MFDAVVVGLVVVVAAPVLPDTPTQYASSAMNPLTQSEETAGFQE